MLSVAAGARGSGARGRPRRVTANETGDSVARGRKSGQAKKAGQAVTSLVGAGGLRGGQGGGQGKGAVSEGDVEEARRRVDEARARCDALAERVRSEMRHVPAPSRACACADVPHARRGRGRAERRGMRAAAAVSA